MYASIYLSISIYLSTYLSIYLCIYGCMHVCMCACMSVCLYACMHVCMHGCMYGCMHACMYACMYACNCVCVYIYMHQILELNIVMNMMMNLHEALRCCSRRPFLDDGSAKHGRFPSPCQINYWRREWWTLIILIWSRLILGCRIWPWKHPESQMVSIIRQICPLLLIWNPYFSMILCSESPFWVLVGWSSILEVSTWSGSNPISATRDSGYEQLKLWQLLVPAYPQVGWWMSMTWWCITISQFLLTKILSLSVAIRLFLPQCLETHWYQKEMGYSLPPIAK